MDSQTPWGEVTEVSLVINLTSHLWVVLLDVPVVLAVVAAVVAVDVVVAAAETVRLMQSLGLAASIAPMSWHV